MAKAETALWGIDLGGTKIEGVVLESAQAPRVVRRMRMPTEAERGYPHVVRQIAALVDTLAAEVGHRPQRLGLGAPGVIRPGGGVIRGSNCAALVGESLGRDLTDTLGLPVVVANDANCFALAETRLGAVRTQAPAARVVFGVILGTGVGGGVVVGGEVLGGAHGVAGEWGHTFLDASGGPCHCGSSGCVERIISGPALEAYYRERAAHALPLREIARAADPHARATMDRLVAFFGRAIAVVINALDPDIIVLGGGLSNIDRLYTEGAAAAAEHVFTRPTPTLMVRPELGDSAGVFGAALLTAPR